MIPSPPFFTRNGPWAHKVRQRSNPLLDYEAGGSVLNNPEAGLFGYLWVADYVGGNIRVYREDIGPDSALLYARAGVTRIGISFDQNMAPVYAIEDGDGAFLRLFSSGAGGYVDLPIPGASTLCVTLDERRRELISDSDVIVSYMRGGDLCCRVQRENYGIEHVLLEDAGASLDVFGMSLQGFPQWRYS